MRRLGGEENDVKFNLWSQTSVNAVIFSAHGRSIRVGFKKELDQVLEKWVSIFISSLVNLEQSMGMCIRVSKAASSQGHAGGSFGKNLALYSLGTCPRIG